MNRLRLYCNGFTFSLVSLSTNPFMSRFFLLASFCVFIVYNAFAQHQLPRNFQAAVANKTRTMTGEPGTFYWHNKADYAIHMKFTPKSRKIVGTETITYYNNSPDTLK